MSLETQKVNPLQFRMFGMNICQKCAALKTQFEQARLDFVYVDADADGNQDLCDEHNIDQVPVVQIINGNRVVWHEVVYDLQVVLDAIASLK